MGQSTLLGGVGVMGVVRMRRILVVANQTVGGEELAEVVKARVAQEPCEFWLLVPATPPADQPLGFAAAVADAPVTMPRSIQVGGDAFALARKRLRHGLDRLRGLGATAHGDVGSGNPLEAIREAVARREFDEIIISTLPSGVSRWLRQDLPHRVERQFKLPLTVVTASPGTY
jgi:hypothetical protein